MSFECRLIVTIREAIAIGVAACALAVACLPELETSPPRPPTPRGALFSCGDGLIALSTDGGETCDPGEAGVTGCTRDCRVECTGGVIDPTTGHCYWRAPEAADFEAALAACSGPGTHLVTFNSEEERRFVRERFAPSGTGLWVGLVQRLDAYGSARERVEPGWAPECEGCYAPTVDGGFLGDAGPCLVDEANGAAYERVACRSAEPRVVVCEREPPGATIEPCAGGFCIVVPKTLGQKRYLYVPYPAAASAAASGCAALGGTLALFDTAAERESVLAEVQRIVVERKEAWVGLASGAGDASSNAYLWDDDAGHERRPSVWGRGEPRRLDTPARAAVLLLPLTGGTSSEVDVQLARALEAAEERPYLCQY